MSDVGSTEPDWNDVEDSSPAFRKSCTRWSKPWNSPKCPDSTDGGEVAAVAAAANRAAAADRAAAAEALAKEKLDELAVVQERVAEIVAKRTPRDDGRSAAQKSSGGQSR